MGRHSDDSDGAIFRSRWAFFALQSIANVYRHLNTEHHALVTTVVNATLDVFSLEDFWHKDADQNTIFHNFLSSLSIIFAGLSTALPPLGATAGATSGLVGGANALYERAVKSSPDDLSLSRAPSGLRQAAPKSLDRVLGTIEGSLQRVDTRQFNQSVNR